MSVKCSPDETSPTHHLVLKDRWDREVPLLLCDSEGRVPKKLAFGSNAEHRTSFKQTSGNLDYNSFEYPYSPIVQDNWQGGRGNLVFESDATKYLDGYRVRASIEGKLFAGPQEQFSKGYRNLDQSDQGDVDFHTLTGQALQVARKFSASASYTVAKVWVLLRKRGNPADLTIALHADSGGSFGAELNSVSFSADELDDILSEWVVLDIDDTALTSGTSYWLAVYADSGDDDNNHWDIGVEPVEGSTYYSDDMDLDGLADFDLYYRVTVADTEGATVIPFEYKEELYCVVSPPSGAPEIWMNGDRGAADPNTGALDTLVDATKSWTTDQWAGCMAVIVDGTGKMEPIPYREITENDGTTLSFDTAWTIEHDTTTEYVIVGADEWRSLGACGLTVPVTDVMVTTRGIVYFALGDDVNIRRMRAYNDSGTWRDLDDATNCQANEGSTAVFLIEAELQDKYYRIENFDANENVSYSTASPIDWSATNLSFGTEVRIGNRYRRATGAQVYSDAIGQEAVWIGKTGKPHIATQAGTQYPFPFEEMGIVRSPYNFKASLKHDYFLYFTLGDEGRIQRWYDGKLDDVGPSQGEGLPENRRGPVVSLLGYPGTFICAVDAGEDGYSSVLEQGWHELYRTPKGESIKAIYHQHIPGMVGRLWVWQGCDMVWLPSLPLSNELENSAYRFTHECALESSRMHAGLLDTKKLAKWIKLATDKLVDDTTWIELDYRVDDESEWTTVEDKFTISPIDKKLLDGNFGIAGTRLMIRPRLYTKDASKTPVLEASILEAVSRIGQKDVYSFSVLVADNPHDLTGAVETNYSKAEEKLDILQEWSGDDSDSILYLSSLDPSLDGKSVFLEPYNKYQVFYPTDVNSEALGHGYVVTLILRDA